MGQAVSLRSIVKLTCATGVFALGLWAFWPEEHEARTSDPQTETVTADYVIKFFPGYQYMPGSIPYGLGKPLHGITDVIRDFEQRFPDTHIDVVSAPSAVREYLVTQLSTGAAPDIIMTTVEDVWPDIQKDWYVPLDRYLQRPNSFLRESETADNPGSRQWWDMFKYQAISRAKAAPDGKYYTITFDLVETGIFYNKSLFQEMELEIPDTWEEFLQLLARIDAHGKKDGQPVIPLLVHLDNLNAWAVELFFDQLYYDLLPGIDLVQDSARGNYMTGYLDWDELVFLHEQGFFTRRDPRYAQIWPIMQQLAQYCNRNLLGDVVRDFVTQRGAMLWNISAFAYRLDEDPDIPFEWGVFYLPPFTKTTSEFASGQPMCVVGGPATSYAVTNSAVGDTSPALEFEERIQRSKRLERVIAFLEFLTLPENYRRVVNEYPCFMPNIAGVEVLPTMKPFEETLERRYTTTKWIYTFDLKFSEVQRRMIELYLSDGISLEEFLDEWQIPNVAAACARAQRRKNYDEAALETAWQRLAPVRAEMQGLPE